MSYETSDKLGLKLCEILGIEPKNVQRLVIDVAVNDVPKVYVFRTKRLLESADCRKIEDLFQDIQRPQIIEAKDNDG